MHSINSEYQSEATKVFVLTPDTMDEGTRYRVLYLLPVERKNDCMFGNAMETAIRLDMANQHNVIIVFPTFSDIPWYADHPIIPGLRQESYLLKSVIPFIEKKYPAINRREGRFLIGFSKSGWGAYTLLLRNMEFFETAAAWDAPLTMGGIGQWGSEKIFGDSINFENYSISSLLVKNTESLKEKTRLVLTGYSHFRENVERTHELLEKLGIPHKYEMKQTPDHRWSEEWLERTVELILDLQSGNSATKVEV